MPLLLPFSLAARWIFAIASFSSSCIVPSRMECPMLFPRSKGPTNRTSMPGTLAIASTCNHQPSALPRRSYYIGNTLSNASFVSICTMVNKASLACCKYSVWVCPPNLSIGNGDPKPLIPVGGNLADRTSFCASSTVCNKGTKTPWADGRQLGPSPINKANRPPESKAPDIGGSSANMHARTFQ